MVRAVITAGGSVDAAFAAEIGTPIKALASFGPGVLIEACSRPPGRRVSPISRRRRTGSDRSCRRTGQTRDCGGNGWRRQRAARARCVARRRLAVRDLRFAVRHGAALTAFLNASEPYDLTLPLGEAADYRRPFRTRRRT